MINRRGFLSSTFLGLSGAYLADCTRLAEAEKTEEVKGSGGHFDLRRNSRRALRVRHRYANIPVTTGAPLRRMRVLLEGAVVRDFYIELAEAEPQWWAVLDLAPFQDKRIVFEVDELPRNSAALKSIVQANTIKGAENLYHERARPQFHFSPRRGWNNDTNGLVFHEGEYHLFYQHNPYGWNWGNLHWGHAVSTDLVHWKELPEALYPDQHGNMFSGSAVVDEHNTAGFQAGDEKAMVAIFTAAPVGNEKNPKASSMAERPNTQGIAFSNDRGRTWLKYAGNPVLPAINPGTRDPNVLWFEPQRKWVMALYLDRFGATDYAIPEESGYGLFSSKDLKNWEKLCDVTLHGDGECPNFFEMPVEGAAGESRWIFSGATGRYLIGTFDGQVFAPESGPHVFQRGNCFYAPQTFNHIPASDGRRILIPWGIAISGMTTAGGQVLEGHPIYKGMPFNQMLGIPVELRLCTTDTGLRLFANPVRELESLRVRSHRIQPQVLKSEIVRAGDNPLAGVKGELLDIVTEIAVRDATEIAFDLRGVSVVYDAKKRELSCGGKAAALLPVGGTIQLRMLVDRTSIDIFGSEGRLYMPMGILVPADNKSLEVYAKGGEAQIVSLEVHELKSAWV